MPLCFPLDGSSHSTPTHSPAEEEGEGVSGAHLILTVSFKEHMHAYVHTTFFTENKQHGQGY